MSENERQSMPIRLTFEALEAGKIAAAFKGLPLAKYASQVLLEAANRDIEDGYRNRGQSKPVKPKRPKGGD